MNIPTSSKPVLYLLITAFVSLLSATLMVELSIYVQQARSKLGCLYPNYRSGEVLVGLPKILAVGSLAYGDYL